MHYIGYSNKFDALIPRDLATNEESKEKCPLRIAKRYSRVENPYRKMRRDASRLRDSWHMQREMEMVRIEEEMAIAAREGQRSGEKYFETYSGDLSIDFATQLKILKEMGFENEVLCLLALKESGGSVPGAMDHMMG